MANKLAVVTKPPRASSSAAKEASVEDNAVLSIDFTNYEGLDLKRLPGYIVPLSSPTGNVSWIFRHGYRLRKVGTMPEKIYFQYKYRHINSKSGGLHQTTLSTTAAKNYSEQDCLGHRLT